MELQLNNELQIRSFIEDIKEKKSEGYLVDVALAIMKTSDRNIISNLIKTFEHDSTEHYIGVNNKKIKITLDRHLLNFVSQYKLWEDDYTTNNIINNLKIISDSILGMDYILSEEYKQHKDILPFKFEQCEKELNEITVNQLIFGYPGTIFSYFLNQEVTVNFRGLLCYELLNELNLYTKFLGMLKNAYFDKFIVMAILQFDPKFKGIGEIPEEYEFLKGEVKNITKKLNRKSQHYIVKNTGISLAHPQAMGFYGLIKFKFNFITQKTEIWR